jgi:protein-S-isoprenylcysteine O-methyltransferase Ste14
VGRFNREVLGDLLARAFVGSLFVLLSVNIWKDYVKTGRFTGLLFLAAESLVVVLMIVRRRTKIVDRSLPTAVLTTISLLGPPLMRTNEGLSLVPDLMTAIVTTVGVTIVIISKVTIGRSFGIAPANRGVVARGPYNIVRHPIYAGYLLTHAAALVAYPSTWNIVVIVGGDIALVLRALAEERVLSADRAYQDYCGRVAWHLVPGVF